MPLFDKITKTFLCNKFSILPTVSTAKGDHRCVKLLFMGRLIFEVRKQFKTPLQNSYPQITITFVFSILTPLQTLKQPTRFMV